MLVQDTRVYAVDAEQKYHDGLKYALWQPQEIVCVVEDSVLLADEVDFRKQAEQVLVYLDWRGEVFLLVEDLLRFFEIAWDADALHAVFLGL